MPESTEERRRSHRVPLALRVLVHPDGGDPVEACARDLSKDGVFVFTPVPYDAGAAITLDIDLEGHDPIRIDGEVVRSQIVREYGSGFGLSGMAVHFERLRDEDRMRLDRLVEAVRSAILSA